MAEPIEELKNRLKEALTYMNMRAIDLSQKTGIPKSSISQYLSGHVKPNSERVYLISKALNVQEAWLMGFDVPKERNVKTETDSNLKLYPPTVSEDYVTYPVIGEIAAGYESVAVEDWSGEKVDIPASYLKGREIDDFFVLGVKGNSMFPEYREGDKVLILKQSTLNYSGQVGAIIYNDDYATLKRVEYKDGEDWMNLVPINPAVETQRIEGVELERCKVLGIPRLLIRDIKS